MASLAGIFLIFSIALIAQLYIMGKLWREDASNRKKPIKVNEKEIAES